MRDPRLSEALPELQREGLLSAEQAARIQEYYATPGEEGGKRMLLLFAILGALLIGLGIILVVAHNWDELSRTLRTVLAFVPVAIGQGLVLVALRKAPEQRSWHEGSAVFLFLAVGACLALVSQIHHLPGELHGFLLTWSLLAVLLLYVPGSIIAALLYIGMITWYACLVRMEHWSNEELPWLYWPMIAAALPLYIKAWKTRGDTVSFAWFSFFVALSLGITSNLFWKDDHLEIALGIAGLATAYALVPTGSVGLTKRTGAFVRLGRLSLLCVLFFLSYQSIWLEGLRPIATLATDALPLLLMLAVGIAAYTWSLRTRNTFSGDLFPETLGALLLAYALARFSPELAALLVNVWLLLLGVRTVRHGLDKGSLATLNLGLAIIGLTVVLRFFDLNINDALKGLVFIAVGVGFLVMNMRLLKQRRTQGDA